MVHVYTLTSMHGNQYGITQREARSIGNHCYDLELELVDWNKLI